MERLTIIGAGTMGHSISLCAAWAGIRVKMAGLNDADVDGGLSRIQKKLGTLRDNELIDDRQVDAILANICTTTDFDAAVEDSTFIIETIPEDLKLKNDLFLYLDKQCTKDVILASNTSGLSLRRITEGASHPERMLITHFWNPAHLIPLVEVLRSPSVTANIFRRCMDFLQMIRKKPIEIKKEVPGLVGNRLQFALFREALHLLEEGIASRDDIDAAVTYTIGRRLSVTGPLMSADMGGLDVFSKISNYLFEDLSKSAHSLPSLEKLVSGGKFGEKSGEGYYLWDRKLSETKTREREQELIRLLKEDRNTGAT